MDRRVFLASAAATTLATANAADKLAVDGGTPVRNAALSTGNWGPLFYDSQEQTQLNQVLESRKPFRFANALDQSKVAIFEDEYAARMRTKYALAARAWARTTRAARWAR